MAFGMSADEAEVAEAIRSADALLAAGHVRVAQGSFDAVAVLDPGMRPGVAKAGFNGRGSHANAVGHAVPDPMTNNYRYKLGRGRVERLEAAAEKTDLKGPSLKPRGLA